MNSRRRIKIIEESSARWALSRCKVLRTSVEKLREDH
jgi:hypothetical protein